ncbi:hypothetical protein J5893_00910 [bacterium]|nr:hypothetical protein [bacterium]
MQEKIHYFITFFKKWLFKFTHLMCIDEENLELLAFWLWKGYIVWLFFSLLWQDIVGTTSDLSFLFD